MDNGRKIHIFIKSEKKFYEKNVGITFQLIVDQNQF